VAKKIDWNKASVEPKVEIAPQTKEEKYDEWGEVFYGALKNAPKSTMRFLGDLWQSVRHPVQTGKGLGNFVIGTTQGVFIPGKQEKEKYLDGFVEFMEDRYGNLDKIKETIATDPVGIFGDVSSFFMGAGAVTKIMPMGGKTGKMLGKTGKTLSTVGAAADPISIGKNLTYGAGGKLISKGIPRKLYHSSLKASSKLSEAQANRIVETALKYGINTDTRGLRKLNNYITQLGSRVDELVETATREGKLIPVERLFDQFDELKKEFTGKPMTAERQIDAVRDEHRQWNLDQGRTHLTPEQAHKQKKIIYKELDTHYAKASESPASIKAQKALANSAMTALDEMIPELRHLNKEELGPFLALKKEVEVSAARIKKKDLFGMSTPMKFAAGGIWGGKAGVALGLSLAALDTPRIKSRLAIVLEKLRKRGIKVTPTQTAIEMGLFQTGRYSRYLKETQEGATQ